MKIDPTIIQALVAMAAIIAGFYGVVTLPIVRMIGYMRTDVSNMRADLLQFKTEVCADFARIDARLMDIQKEVAAQGVRLARVEERLPPPLVHR
jgi:hypothetical protein